MVQLLKKTYSRRRAEAEEQAEAIQAEIDKEMDSQDRRWMNQFRKYQNITTLDRTIVVSLIERILIYREHRVEIVYRWYDEFHWFMDLLKQAQGLHPEKEAV